jgi:hypothetical protein
VITDFVDDVALLVQELPGFMGFIAVLLEGGTDLLEHCG